MKVVLGGFWMVSNGFYWLRVTLDGLRWFALISQHTEYLTLYCIHGRA